VGSEGTLALLRVVFSLADMKRRDLCRILHHVNECAVKGINYDGERYVQSLSSQGRPSSISRGSHEERITANWLESGFGYRETTVMVNTTLVDKGRSLVSRYDV